MGNFWRTYRPSMERYRLEAIYTMVSKIKSIQGSVKILDVGTGLGYVAINLASNLKNAIITGVDLWECAGQVGEGTKVEAERKAALKNVSSNVSFEQSDACDLTFDNNSFDVCVSSFLLSHIRPPRKPFSAMKECKRILKSNGLIAFCDINININTSYNGKYYMDIALVENWLYELEFKNVETIFLSESNHKEIRNDPDIDSVWVICAEKA